MTEVQQLVDAFFAALNHAPPDPPAPSRSSPTAFTVRNAHDYLIVYHGDEAVAKITPEHADQLVGELAMALKTRRGVPAVSDVPGASEVPDE